MLGSHRHFIKMNSEVEELRKRKPDDEEINQDGRDEDEIDSAEQPVASNGIMSMCIFTD